MERQARATGHAVASHHAAGLRVLDAASGHRILYRTPTPLLEPEVPAKREGIVPKVVFPTGIDQRPEAEDPTGFDVSTTA